MGDGVYGAAWWCLAVVEVRTWASLMYGRRPCPALQACSGVLMFTSAWRHTKVLMPSSNMVVRIFSVSASSKLAGYAPAMTRPAVWSKAGNP